ncbi:hypothetical protein AXG93_2789s1150 [Marchantia polymorpha subsp. ruderalis]|uniref:Uncharacterized protein n=1 Tax=Marchantia polymorpha subsp. ruderalis TaxID=1480154 RepID=A0A176WA09_MARPO|nr:hypothetical protein AXG93_2789s1150 [Marchantia polymorpha subsp. ruderalis]
MGADIPGGGPGIRVMSKQGHAFGIVAPQTGPRRSKDIVYKSRCTASIVPYVPFKALDAIRCIVLYFCRLIMQQQQRGREGGTDGRRSLWLLPFVCQLGVLDLKLRGYGIGDYGFVLDFESRRRTSWRASLPGQQWSGLVWSGLLEESLLLLDDSQGQMFLDHRRRRGRRFEQPQVSSVGVMTIAMGACASEEQVLCFPRSLTTRVQRKLYTTRALSVRGWSLGWPGLAGRGGAGLGWGSMELARQNISDKNLSESNLYLLRRNSNSNSNN